MGLPIDQATSNARRVRVLIADDHGLARRQLVRALGDCPSLTVVGQARDGAEAIALVAELRPDVVIADVRMPVLDGFEVTRRLTAAPATPVVLISAFQSPRYREAADAAGARALVAKSADEEEIVKAVLRAAGVEIPS